MLLVFTEHFPDAAQWDEIIGIACGKNFSAAWSGIFAPSCVLLLSTFISYWICLDVGKWPKWQTWSWK